MDNYIVPPFKLSRKELMEMNVTKYVFFSWVLERMAFFHLMKDWKEVPLKLLEESVYETSLISKKEMNTNLRSQWLQELQAMQLIVLGKNLSKNEDYTFLTEKGYEAYRKQTYNQIAANLMEAQESRKLSQWALWISLFSLGASLCAGFLGLF